MIKLELIKLLESSENYNNFKLELKKKIPDIILKEDEDIVLIANKFKTNNYNLSDLEIECKNIIIDKNNLKLLVYTNNSLYYNEEANHFILNNDIDKEYEKKIYESYEGTTIVVYYFNEKWYVSTRRCIDSNGSYWTTNKTFYKMFFDTLNCTYEQFTSKLDKKYYYSFILIHHENKNIIDYTNKFGSDYKKIIHIMTRESENHYEVDIDLIKNFEKNNIIKPNILNNFDILKKHNETQNLKLPLELEGIIIKLINKTNHKTILLKLHTNSFKIISKLKPNYNSELKMFIDLYKSELLKEHLIYFPSNININLKYNNNILEYDTIGIIDALFKVITSELFELFKSLYNLKDCSHKNKELYEKIPNEYKIILYQIRGRYFEKKEELTNLKLMNENINYKNYNLKIIDIYNILKNYDINSLFKLILSRNKLLDLNKFKSNISNRCDSNLLEMTNIYINNLL